MRNFAFQLSFLLVVFASVLLLSANESIARSCEGIFQSVQTPMVNVTVSGDSETRGNRAPWLAVDAGARFSAWKQPDSVEIVVASDGRKITHRVENDLAGMETVSISGDGVLVTLSRDSFREEAVVNLESGRTVYRASQEEPSGFSGITVTENGFFVFEPAIHRVSIYDADGKNQGTIELPRRKFYSTGETSLIGETLDMWSVSYSSIQRRLVLVPLGLSDRPAALVFAHIGNRFRQVSSFPVLEEAPSVKLSMPLSNAEIAAQQLQYADYRYAILAAHQSREMELTRISDASVDFGASTLHALMSRGSRSEIVSSIERFELRTGRLVDTVELTGLTVREFSFRSDGQRLAIAGIRFTAGSPGARVVAIYQKDPSGSWTPEIDIPYSQVATRPRIAGSEQVKGVGWVDAETIWVQTAAGQLNRIQLTFP